MERKYANNNQIFTKLYNSNNDLEDAGSGGYLARQKSVPDGLLTAQTGGVSKVRRMARALEENCGELTAKMSNAAREMFARAAPRSLDQLARFNSISDLSHRQKAKGNVLKAAVESPLVIPGNSVAESQKMHASMRSCDTCRPSATEHGHAPENKIVIKPSYPLLRDQSIHMRPYVIIKETIRCSPAPPNECYVKPAERVMLHTPPGEINGGRQFSRDKHVRFRPAFEHWVSDGSCWDGDTSKYCSSAAASFPVASEFSKPLTFDHILLRKSSNSPPPDDRPVDARSGSAEQVYPAYRKSVQDNCSSESGYLSDCSLLYCRPEQPPPTDSAILTASCFQSKLSAAVDDIRSSSSKCDKRCARDYSPRSTASSMNSAGSAPASSCRLDRVKGQAIIYTQLSLDSTLKSYYASPAVPGFARHTEASKRRSKKQSVSIPDNLNDQLMNSMTSSWCIQRRDQSDDSLLTSQRNSQTFKAAATTKQSSSADVTDNVLRKEWEPQGEYHVFKKWCDSLRKYEGKNKAAQHHLNNLSTSHSPSNRRSLVECAVPRHSQKQSNDKQQPEFNAAQQSALTQNLIKNENNAFSDQGGALSKAISLDCVCAETKSVAEAQHQNPWSRNGERSIHPVAAGKFGAPHKLVDCSPKFPMLDTVREENVNGVSQAEKVLLRAKPQPAINPPPVKVDHASMNRYFSEANLSMQCQILGAQATCSDILICKENMPLRYKRESWLKRYGTEEAINCIPPLNQVVELEPDAEPPFERRNVVPRKNKRPEDEFTFGEFLGRGKFGEVKKCTENKTKKELAAKFVPVRSEIDRNNVYNEVEVMNSLQHPRLLQLYEAFDCGKEIVLIMELISGGELFERVIDDDFILTEMLCEVYVRQICEGIEFMHKENFLHLDMKPENILCINRDGHRIKIIDFGLARRFKPGDTLRILFGTPEFVAPEVVSYEKIGQGTDLWSVGVICYVLLSGLSPFMGDNDAETYNNINHVEYDFDDESFEEISDDAKDFISKLLVLKPENRMTATECLQHPWLTRHSNPEEPRADNVKINTKKLKRFVIRRRWQKAVNVLLALKRMGMSL